MLVKLFHLGTSFRWNFLKNSPLFLPLLLKSLYAAIHVTFSHVKVSTCIIKCCITLYIISSFTPTRSSINSVNVRDFCLKIMKTFCFAFLICPLLLWLLSGVCLYCDRFVTMIKLYSRPTVIPVCFCFFLNIFRFTSLTLIMQVVLYQFSSLRLCLVKVSCSI